jgi:hypothetical protein
MMQSINSHLAFFFFSLAPSSSLLLPLLRALSLAYDFRPKAPGAFPVSYCLCLLSRPPPRILQLLPRVRVDHFEEWKRPRKPETTAAESSHGFHNCPFRTAVYGRLCQFRSLSLSICVNLRQSLPMINLPKRKNLVRKRRPFVLESSLLAGFSSRRGVMPDSKRNASGAGRKSRHTLTTPQMLCSERTVLYGIVVRHTTPQISTTRREKSLLRLQQVK